jgi:hypothetical protein
LTRTPDTARIRADVETLAGMVRASASTGERASAEWVAERLREAGAADVRLETFRYQGTYAWAHAAHLAAGVAAARLGGLPGAALAGLALASLEGEASGRRQWLRRLLPAGEGTNVVARIPAAGDARRKLVLVAHHDAARGGLIWHPRVKRIGAERALRRRAIDPALGPAAAALGAVAAGCVLPGAAGRALRGAGSVLLGVGIAAYADVATSDTVPGATDNATGVAAVLELGRTLAAQPLPGVEVILVFTGCEESGMGGMTAFLAGAALDPQRTLVLGLDHLGGDVPIVLSAEATLLEHAYRPEDVALAEAGAARAGLEPPERWRLGTWTDPVLARLSGLPAISLLSMGPGYLREQHLPTDVPDRVDWDCVQRCARIAGGIAEEVAARAPEGVALPVG